LDHVDSIFNEPFIGTSSKNLKPIHNDDANQRTYLNPRQEVEIEVDDLEQRSSEKIRKRRWEQARIKKKI
jgi:hypothetical protein